MRTTDDSQSHRIRYVRRVLSAEELLLWQRATADVRPLSTPEPGEGPEPDRTAAEVRPTAAEPVVPSAQGKPKGSPPIVLSRVVVRPRPTDRPSPVSVELAPGVAPGLDIRTLMRLRRGMIPPQAEIDLHQCTQSEAHALLASFLSASQARGRRCVLVITGKGYGRGGTVGVLKTMVPRWLNEPPVRPLVIAFTHASAQHGGEGALYVLLRRRREKA